jgi:protein disulfide-isomerase-like protein
MRVVAVLVAVVLCAHMALADEDSDWLASKVAHLGQDTFDGFIVENPSTLVMFYAPWCGHCKKMKPAYGEASAVVNTATDKPQKLAAVDCTAHAELCNKFGVRGYPTIKYFKAGKEEFKYEGGRTKEALIAYMNDPKAPPPPPVATPFSDDPTPNDVVMLTDTSFPGFIAQNPKVLVMFYAPWCGHCKRAKPFYIEAAAELKGTTHGVLAAVDCTVEKRICGQHQVKGYPTLIYFAGGKNMKFGGARTKEGFLEFMKNPVEAPAEPAAAAAEPQKPQEAAKPTPFDETGKPNDVAMLTDVTFDAHIKQYDASGSLVMFYAPWCGHCKKAKPAYVEAAALAKSTGKGSLAAVDCTVHKDLCGKYGVKGFPTILFFKGGKNDKYNGGRTKDDFVTYMNANAGGAAAGAAHDEL